MGKRSKRRGSSFENEDDREPLTQGQTVMTSSSSFGSLPSHARVGESVSLPTLGRALQRRVTTTFTEQKQTAQPDILPSVAESHPELFASNSKRDDAHAAGPFPATPGAAPAENVQSVREYLLAESNPKSSQPERDLLLLTERDKLYNSIIRIPYQLERMLLFGQLLCLDCFLAVFTMLPYRGVRAVGRLGAALQGREGALQGHHLADILCVSVFACSAATVRSVKAGSIYYWMKDITPEFLKIHALYGALEIFNIIFANYGVSVVSALCGTCSLLLDPDTELLQRGTVSLEQSTRRWKRKRLKRLVQLAADAALMYAVITLHALVIMSQAITFSVVLNSSQNALIALLVAANFGEIKGIVYKKWDANKLEAMAIMDLTERFHLLVILLFIVVEDMQSNDSMLPTRHVLVECLRILLAEVFIDNIKHAVLTKKDNLRPGIFREFFKDMCDKYQDCQSWDAYKIVMFSPYATAVLCVRIGTTFLAIAHDNDQAASALGPLLAPSWSLSATLLLLAWFAAFLFKLALGYGLKVCANTYKRYYDCNYSKLGRHRDNKKDK